MKEIAPKFSLLIGLFALCTLLLIPYSIVTYSEPVPVQFATSEWPPFEYQENGQQKGSDIEVMKAVFKGLALPLEIKFYPWLRCEEMAKNKEVDGIFTVGKNPEREKFVIYPGENISLSENVFFCRADSKLAFNSYSDLKGLVIGVTSGYNYGEPFMSGKGYTLNPGSSDEIGFTKLVNKRLDLFICDRLVGIYLIRKLGLEKQVSFLPKPVSSIKMYAAFAKKVNANNLSSLFDSALAKLKSNGVYQSIISSYTKIGQ